MLARIILITALLASCAMDVGRAEQHICDGHPGTYRVQWERIRAEPGFSGTCYPHPPDSVSLSSSGAMEGVCIPLAPAPEPDVMGRDCYWMHQLRCYDRDISLTWGIIDGHLAVRWDEAFCAWEAPLL